MLPSCYNIGSISYTFRAGFIFIWVVPLTHPVLSSFLYRFFSLTHPVLAFFLFFFIYFFLIWRVSLTHPELVSLFMVGVSLTHPVLASFLSREFL